jgi:hypothetical protein
VEERSRRLFNFTDPKSARFPRLHVASGTDLQRVTVDNMDVMFALCKPSLSACSGITKQKLTDRDKRGSLRFHDV